MFRHIVLATDFTEVSRPAEDTAAELAKTLAARLTVVHVCETPAFAAAASGLVGADLVAEPGNGHEAALGRLLWRLRGRRLAVEGLLRHGLPWEQIVAVVREVGADLVVTGTHGRHGIAHAYYGSVAERIVQQSPVPVLAVPRGG